MQPCSCRDDLVSFIALGVYVLVVVWLDLAPWLNSKHNVIQATQVYSALCAVP